MRLYRISRRAASPRTRNAKGRHGMVPAFLLPLLASLLLAFLGGGTAAHAEDEPVRVDSLTLMQSWEDYDGEEVVFVGEAVGDVMVRGEQAWITVNDDHYSRRALAESAELRGGNSGIGVWLSREEAAKITRLGRYGSIGDRVSVRGVFHADCPEHGGDFDIHASSLEVLERGREIVPALDSGKPMATALSLLFLAATSLPFYLRRLADRRRARSLLRED